VRAMPKDARALVVVSTPADVAICRRTLGPEAEDRRVEIVVVGQPLSPWARDRCVFVPRPAGPSAVVPPAASVRPAHRGDLLVPGAVRRHVPTLMVEEPGFVVPGGDLLVVGPRLLVGATTVRQNAGGIGPEARPFLDALAAVFERKVLVVGATVETLPHEHLDMYLTPLDDRTLALGDPRLALDVFQGPEGPRADVEIGELGLFTFRAQVEVAPAYDAIRAELEAAGYEVRRLPILHGRPQPKTLHVPILTWNNVLLTREDGRRVALVPQHGPPAVDARAHELWRSWGFEARPIPLGANAAFGGAVRCMVNVLETPLDGDR